MTTTFDIQTGLWIVCIVNVSFAIGLLLLRSDRVWDGARLWFVGNLFGLGAALWRISFEPGWISPVESIQPAIFMLLTNLFKVAALVRRRQRLRVAAVGGVVIAVQVIAAWLDNPIDDFNLALGSAGLFMALLLAWQGWICFTEPRWKRLRGRNLFVASTALIVVFSVLASLRAFSVRPGAVIFSEAGPAQINLVTVLSYVIFSHICLIAMLMDRLNRTVVVSDLRQRKESRLARQAEAHAHEMAALAQEKQSLLEVLIHEVRQPLNNAQAALQHVMMSLEFDGRDRETGRRLQAIIDKIVLSLTNAIVGASVLERKSQSRLVSTEITAICQLACSDTGPNWADRVELENPDQEIIAEADPVLLRLAIRNLIDNAIKHSASGTKVIVTIVDTVSANKVQIFVANVPAEPFTPDPRLLDRGARGLNASAEGRGLGLYIAHQIAQIHNGRLDAQVGTSGQTEFVLTIRH